MEPDNGLSNKQNDTKETVIASSAEISSSTTQMPVDSGADDSIQDKPKKKSHAMAIGMVFLAILAIGGIGFGVWAWTSGETQNKRYEEDIANLRSQLVEATQPVEENVIIIDNQDKSKDEDVNTSDYIYIGEWGIKIEIDKLKMIDMSFGLREDKNMEIVQIAVAPEDQYSDASRKFYNIQSYPNNFIARSKQATIKPYSFMGIQDDYYPVYNDGEYNYFTYKPTGYNVGDLANPDAIVQAYNEMTVLLNDPDSYSEI